MIKKVVGYGLAGIGILGLVCASVPGLSAAVPGISSLGSGLLTALSLVLVVVGGGLVYLQSRGMKKGTEVPIYEGKKVVGYRRL